jgi:hypothetical protein
MSNTSVSKFWRLQTKWPCLHVKYLALPRTNMSPSLVHAHVSPPLHKENLLLSLSLLNPSSFQNLQLLAMVVGDDGFVGHESLTRCSSRVSPTGRPKQERLGDASTGKSRLKAMSVPVLTLIFTHILPLSVYIIHTHKY